jgi:hypothetical protein
LKRVVLVSGALVVALVASSKPALAGPCGLPSSRPLWVDVAGGPFWWKVFARPGLVLAITAPTRPSDVDIPSELRAAGARTIYWDNYLKRRVGTPTRPTDPATIVERANRLFDHAARATRCATPFIGVNELFGASTATPWSTTNAQYRANVLTYLRTLAARGARPFLAVPTSPYTAGEAAQWWRDVAKVADIVREVYVPAPPIYRQGPVLGSRTLRDAYRRGATKLLAIGVPAARIGLFLGFQTTPGHGGREGLEPAPAWFRVVKLQAFAARSVAAELHLGSIWSWGWSSWRTNPREADPDKAAAACVYLWARNPRLCDGPRAAGPRFQASRAEGQIPRSRAIVCVASRQRIVAAALSRWTVVTGDREVAYTALFGALVTARHVPLTSAEIEAAERAVVALQFRGNETSYRAALARAGLTGEMARTAIADMLRQARIKRRLPTRAPAAGEIAEYYRTYAGSLARLARVTPAAAWLGTRRVGVALSSFAPPPLFALPAHRRARVRTLEGTFAVEPLGASKALAAFPLRAARASIGAALTALARERAFDEWTVRAQANALRTTVCKRDSLPMVDSVSLSAFVPFLAQVM